MDGLPQWPPYLSHPHHPALRPPPPPPPPHRLPGAGDLEGREDKEHGAGHTPAGASGALWAQAQHSLTSFLGTMHQIAEEDRKTAAPAVAPEDATAAIEELRQQMEEMAEQASTAAAELQVECTDAAAEAKSFAEQGLSDVHEKLQRVEDEVRTLRAEASSNAQLQQETEARNVATGQKLARLERALESAEERWRTEAAWRAAEATAAALTPAPAPALRGDRDEATDTWSIPVLADSSCSESLASDHGSAPLHNPRPVALGDAAPVSPQKAAGGADAAPAAKTPPAAAQAAPDAERSAAAKPKEKKDFAAAAGAPPPPHPGGSSPSPDDPSVAAAKTKMQAKENEGAALASIGKTKSKGDAKSKKKKDDRFRTSKKKEENIMPPPFIPQVFRQKAVNRAIECMEETDPEERVTIMKEDFRHYAGLVMEDTGVPHEDAHIIALHEVLRGIAKSEGGEKHTHAAAPAAWYQHYSSRAQVGVPCPLQAEGRTLLVTYLQALVETEVVSKQDVLRASAWFLETAAVMRIVEDTPFVYKRVVEAFLVLMDFPQMMEVLQMAFKGTTQWFEGQEADLQLVESVDELHDELATRVFKAYMKKVEVEENITGRKVLDLIMTNMHKAGSPKMTDGTTTFLFMVATVLLLNIVDNTALSSFYANLQNDPTESRHSMIESEAGGG